MDAACNGGPRADSFFSAGLLVRGGGICHNHVQIALLLPALLAVPAALTDSGSVDLRLTVPRVMALQLDAHPTRVHVTPEDVARGEVVVRGPRVRIAANDRNGFLLRAELRGDTFSGFAVDGLPAPVGCECASAVAPMRVAGNRLSTEVAYRLRLASNAAPGVYGWPVTLSLQDP